MGRPTSRRRDAATTVAPDRREWLILIHALPSEPAYVRVKVRRRLRRLGAVPLKNSVYVLPATSEHLEDFTWLASEIIGEGGQALVARGSFIAGVDEAELRNQPPTRPALAAGQRDAMPRGSTWVTRRDVFVDRIASAWLIRKWIDEAARFRFVSQGRYKPRRGEVRFDMYGGEYTHVGNRCTFETLLDRFGLDDPALRAIGEVVHDIDLKDGRYGRPQTAELNASLARIASESSDDADRIERGSKVFDRLYRELSGHPRPPRKRARGGSRG
ncbi:MAG TPA: chromate resistance protein ChrB domain-containing protein [Gemmatimonadaceae bacterium]|nr:chromate resistance protein ChrB domain-containing protein [Gemmatimonadaceae bacterium]